MRPVPIRCCSLFLIASLTFDPAFAASVAGRASWYGPGFAGKPMANGCPFDPALMQAASRSLPLGTRARVRLRGKSVIVQITDRGPYVAGRTIDLAAGAAAKLGMLREGVAPVAIEVLAWEPPARCR